MSKLQIGVMIMVELDNNPHDLSPVPPHELVVRSVKYLKPIGVKRRS